MGADRRAEEMAKLSPVAEARVRSSELVARTDAMTGEPIGRRRLAPFSAEVAGGTSVPEVEASLQEVRP